MVKSLNDKRQTDRRTLTEALSSTFMLSLSQISLLRSSFSNVHSGSDSHLPNTTRSMSL